jgi:hypothetical protein
MVPAATRALIRSALVVPCLHQRLKTALYALRLEGSRTIERLDKYVQSFVGAAILHLAVSAAQSARATTSCRAETTLCGTAE